ncbi:MAG: ABC transporter permease [Thaumarchaeota archaeon]|nr:ABC transporter permease [Nitrososphaerota archaeon]
MGIGETLVILSGKEDLDLSIGAIASLAIVLGAQLLNNYPTWVVVILVIMIGLMFGMFNGIGVQIFNVPPLVMTYGTGLLTVGIGIAYTGGHPTGHASPLLKQMAVGRIGGIPISILIWIVFSIASIYLLHKTVYGRCLYACGSNAQAAYVAGIPINKIKIITYALSGGFAAFAGLLILGRVETPTWFNLAESYTLPIIAAVILGGTNFAGGEGGYIGTVGGILALVTLSCILPILRISEAGRSIVNGIVLLVILLFYAKRKPIRV